MKKKQTYYILIGLFLTVGWFYWLQWRPTQIRKKCYQETFGKVIMWVEENKKGNKEWAPGKKWMDNSQKGKWEEPDWGWWYSVPKEPKTVEYWFARCLNKNGIKVSFPH